MVISGYVIPADGMTFRRTIGTLAAALKNKSLPRALSVRWTMANSSIGEKHFAIAGTGIRMDFTSFRPGRTL